MAKRGMSGSIDEKLAAQLDRAAPDTSRKRSYFISPALKESLEEVEDHEIALARRGGESMPVDQAERDLGLR